MGFGMGGSVIRPLILWSISSQEGCTLNTPDQRPIFNFERMQEAWESLQFRAVQINDPRIERFVDGIKSAFQKVVFKCFEVSESPAFEFYVQLGYLDALGFVERLLKTLAARSDLPPSKADTTLDVRLEPYLNGFTLDAIPFR